MIKLENTEVMGWEAAIRGMRNPKNSWEKSDSGYCNESCMDWADGCPDVCVNSFKIGPNDHKLMTQLASGGPVHAKYRRMITVYVDITAPLYWWKEFDTYKVGTVANSCSTMHKIQDNEFTWDDFSCEHLFGCWDAIFGPHGLTSRDIMWMTICQLNAMRELYLDGGTKDEWWQMIQLLPSSYNQKRTVMLNYEVLAGIYPMRKNHKLDEWHDFCHWIESLPYSELITGGSDVTNA